MAFNNLDRLIFKYLKKRGWKQKEVADRFKLRPQTVHKFKTHGVPDKYYRPLFEELRIPSKEIIESIRKDFRI